MEDVRRMLRPRREDAHKGDFGHALLVCWCAVRVGWPGRLFWPPWGHCAPAAAW